MLGRPNAKEVSAMNPMYTGKLPDVVPIFPLKKVFSYVHPLGVDLMTKLLRYDPKERMEPIDALLHPFFDSLR